MRRQPPGGRRLEGFLAAGQLVAAGLPRRVRDPQHAGDRDGAVRITLMCIHVERHRAAAGATRRDTRDER